MSNGHAVYAPSAAYRNLNCLGAIALVRKEELRLAKEGKTKEPSEYSKEGTVAHDWIEKCLMVDEFELDEQVKALDLCLDQEMKMHIRNYLGFLAQLRKNFSATFSAIEVHSEYKVKYDDELWGTADYVIIGHHKDGKRVEAVLVDFKYGRGVEVDAEENEQLTCYALCLEQQHGVKFDKVHAFIYQPRTPGKEFTRWTMDRAYLNTQNKLIAANKKQCLQIVQTDTGHLHTNAGEWCRFCIAKNSCPSFLDNINSTALKVLDTAPPVVEVATLTMEQKLAIFARRKVITQLIKEVSSELHDMALQGHEVPGHKLVYGRKSRKWAGDVLSVGTALKQLGCKDPYKLSLVGIGEVEKEIGKGKIDSLTCYTEPSVQLVPVTDKREAITSGLENLQEIAFSEE